ISSGTGCCIDENYNRICDSAEAVVAPAPREVQVSLPPRICGDRYCNMGENWSACPQDCGCPAGYILQGGSCKKFTYMPGTFSVMEFCGNGVCKP
ncbi:MAG: hypothetical protein N3G22_05040, partial [Candidatus Micrarchaeota archaeon]|nr:hypothetical protein [Candidatus Micrarchaeota archaeon]